MTSIANIQMEAPAAEIVLLLCIGSIWFQAQAFSDPKGFILTPFKGLTPHVDFIAKEGDIDRLIAANAIPEFWAIVGDIFFDLTIDAFYNHGVVMVLRKENCGWTKKREGVRFLPSFKTFAYRLTQ